LIIWWLVEAEAADALLAAVVEQVDLELDLHFL
jgi:hypothetical protein